ncbi:MAG: replicative DNA helicase [Actinobacteria bacterium]|nr:replicative DNA helicase [Actinomycetota bacterium]MBI3687251.1 replicative DNA helicase [Actinomycetota bacterium]
MTDLPHDLAAERAVLGAAMLAASAADDVDHLDPGDFYDHRHGALLALIRAMRESGQPVDLGTVGGRLLTDPIPGLAPHDLQGLAADVPTVGNASWYARIVADTAVRRRLIAAGMRVQQMAHGADDAPGSAAELCDRARVEIDAAATTSRSGPWVTVGESIAASLDEWERAAEFTPTAWPDLNRLINGWAPGRMYVVAARPGVGKSIFGVQAAADVARHGIGACVFSLEMGRAEIDARLVSSVGRVDYALLERRQLGDGEWRRIAEAVNRLSDLPLWVDDQVPLRVHDIRSRVRGLARTHPIRLVVVDYLQLLAAPAGSGRTARHEIVGEFSRALKLLAKELGVAVLVLSQLNRASEIRADKKPSMADLRESGEIEQNADMVALLHRDADDDPSRVAVAVAKNRQGERGGFPLRFAGQHCRLESMAKVRPIPGVA